MDDGSLVSVDGAPRRVSRRGLCIVCGLFLFIALEAFLCLPPVFDHEAHLKAVNREESERPGHIGVEAFVSEAVFRARQEDLMTAISNRLETFGCADLRFNLTNAEDIVVTFRRRKEEELAVWWALVAMDGLDLRLRDDDGTCADEAVLMDRFPLPFSLGFLSGEARKGKRW